MKASILIVDDDADTRTMLAAFITGEGYEAVLAGDGEAAIARFDEERPDLVLLDAVMPGLDGFETCRRIKARNSAANTPVIFMTGLTQSEHVVLGLAAGGVDYVTKPLVLSELAARIRVHLGNALKARQTALGLERVGAQLFSCGDDGKIGWITPEAEKILALLTSEDIADLQAHIRTAIAGASTGPQTFGSGSARVSLTLLGSAGGDEHLFKLARSSEGIETLLLQSAFGLTPREADVLLWTARGKSNRDMSEILNISARTVNKHLEQIFIKIGVENRASAATAATRVIYAN